MHFNYQFVGIFKELKHFQQCSTYVHTQHNTLVYLNVYRSIAIYIHAIYICRYAYMYIVIYLLLCLYKPSAASKQAVCINNRITENEKENHTVSQTFAQTQTYGGKWAYQMLTKGGKRDNGLEWAINKVNRTLKPTTEIPAIKHLTDSTSTLYSW